MRDALGRFESLLVLGGTSDIALATVEAAIDAGTTRIVLAGRDAAALAQAAAGLTRPGVEVRSSAFDAEDIEGQPTELEALFDDETFDVVLVAFGILGDQSLAATDPAEAVRIARINFVGAIAALTVVAGCMRRQGHGAIAVLSSVAARPVRASNYAYGASKAGLDGFALGLGDALAPEGIHVCVIRPGFVRTKMTADLKPAPLATDPATVALAILEGLRRRRSIVWAPRAIGAVSFVLDHLPRAVLRLLPV